MGGGVQRHITCMQAGVQAFFASFITNMRKTLARPSSFYRVMPGCNDGCLLFVKVYTLHIIIDSRFARRK